MEEVLFETENRQSRSEVAEYFRAVADKLDSGSPITLDAGDQRVSLDVPDQPTFEVKAEREGTEPHTELSVEFELEWDEHGDDGGGGGGGLSIE